MTSGGKSNERKSYNYTTVFVCACVSDYRHEIFQFSHHVLSIENSCTSYIPTDLLKISETDVWDRLANHPFQSCSHTHVPLRSGCLMSGKSNRPTQVIQIQRQLQIAFVRFKVVYDRAARVIPTRLQMRTTAAVLASLFVLCECLSP